MPYIKPDNRPKFKEPILQALGVLKDTNDTLYVKGEYLGYFINRACKRFLADPEYTRDSFNSAHFNEAKKKALSNAADSIAALLNRADPISAAGELNYALSAVIWGWLGECSGFPQTGYGLRAYVEGVLDKIKSSVETVNTGNQRDMAMAFRRHLVIRGVFSHISLETYRLKTSVYEDQKIKENESVWEGGDLVMAVKQ